jgi:hypothetical protein
MASALCYHPDLGGAADFAVLSEHPAMVGQEHLQGVAHGDDKSHPQPCAEEDIAHHVLRLGGQAATARTKPGRFKCISVGWAETEDMGGGCLASSQSDTPGTPQPPPSASK